MKLYYSPFACSFAAHIVCLEAALDVELIRVDLPTKRTALGGSLYDENPMGQVPTLVLHDGRILTENVAMLSYLGDRMPSQPGQVGPELADAYEVTQWLAFVATEIHKKVLWPIYSALTPDSVKEYARSSGEQGLTVAAARLESRDVLAGGTFTAADAYLFWALTVLSHSGIALARYPSLERYHGRHRNRPAVRAAYLREKDEYARPFAGT